MASLHYSSTEQSPNMQATYRVEIDGLRAVAVLIAIVYHLAPGLMPGGFVGVDIFFVISGYLITRNILLAKSNGTFNAWVFYLKRLRRLYPTYISVIAVSSIVAWYVLTPEALSNYAWSLATSLFYYSNIHFWTVAGYFDLGADLKPLLHTWSLSVEEQFYASFPLLLWIVALSRIRITYVLLAISAITFLLNVMHVAGEPTAVFYLIQFRAWEFGFGSLLAVGFYPNGLSRVVHGWLLYAGALCMLASFFMIDSSSQFPGWLALLPVMGAYLVIGSAPLAGKNHVSALLRNRLMAVIGLMSYALYLWHWPAIVFYRLYFIKEELLLPDILVIALIVAPLSWVSTYVVEPRIRYGNIRPSVIVAAIIFISVLFTALGYHIVTTHGAAYRYANSAFYDKAIIREQTLEQQLAPHDCGALLKDFPYPDQCTQYGSSDKIDFVLWGDSHVINLAKALALSGNHTFLAINTPGCPPLAHVRRADDGEFAHFCNKGINDAVFDAIKKLAPSHVVLVSRWSIYHHGFIKNDILQSSQHFLCDTNCGDAATPESSLQVLQRNYATTVAELGKYSVVVTFKGTPVLKRRGEEIIYMRPAVAAHYHPTHVSHAEFNQQVNRMIDDNATLYAAKVIDPAVELCAQESCTVADDASLYYIDDNHITVQGWLSMKASLSAFLQVVEHRQ